MDEKTMKTVYILPTGDEIKNGTVLDLDAPEIVRMTVKEYPECEVIRMCPLLDIEDTIFNKISEIAQREPEKTLPTRPLSVTLTNILPTRFMERTAICGLNLYAAKKAQQQ